MNKVVLSGRLTHDPEVRFTQSGKAVTAFNIAVNRFHGEQEQVDFIPIVTWERLAETCGNNLVKGRRVLVAGRLQIRSYETTSGERRKVAEVVASRVEFMDGKKKGDLDDLAAQFGKDMGFDMGEIPY